MGHSTFSMHARSLQATIHYLAGLESLAYKHLQEAQREMKSIAE